MFLAEWEEDKTIPISKYFGGSGEKVLSNTKKQYGEKQGKSVFYALVNKSKKREASPRKMGGK